MSLQNRGNNKGNGNEGSPVHEVIKPITRTGFLVFQILQTVTILFLTWVVSKGTDNWLGNLMPDVGYLVMGAIVFQMFMFLWIQKLNISDKAK